MSKMNKIIITAVLTVIYKPNKNQFTIESRKGEGTRAEKSSRGKSNQ